jgi:hypothetical protein
MIYDGPLFVYQNLAEYVDLFITSTSADRLLEIYDCSSKPIVDTDYTTGTPDSAMWSSGKITSLSFNSTSGRTRATVPGFGYRWRKRRFVTWPASAGKFLSGAPPFGGCRGPGCTCGYLTTAAPLLFVEWDTLEWAHDYVHVEHYGDCVRVGDVLQISSSSGGSELYNVTSQAQRAQMMIEEYTAKRNLRGADGKQFVIGFEHWSLHDPQVRCGCCKFC